MDKINNSYDNDLRLVFEKDLPWDELSGQNILVTGATGLIGGCLVDTLMNNGVADTISNRNGVIDTLHASGNFLNGPAAGDDQTTLIWTALAVIAALALCFSLIRLYRKRCCAQYQAQ